MCELFALSCNRKDNAAFSLPLFARYHSPYWDGWGVGYYVGTHARVVRNIEYRSSSISPFISSAVIYFMSLPGPPKIRQKLAPTGSTAVMTTAASRHANTPYRGI